MNNMSGQKMEVKDEPTPPQNWSVPEDTKSLSLTDELDFSFPLATSLMVSLNTSPPTPFSLATLEELALWPSTSSSQPASSIHQAANPKAAISPRRESLTWPQVRFTFLPCDALGHYQFDLLVELQSLRFHKDLAGINAFSLRPMPQCRSGSHLVTNTSVLVSLELFATYKTQHNPLLLNTTQCDSF